VNEKAIELYEEIAIDRLDLEISYLGSTDKWHLFAKIITSFAGDHPFDTIFGYKIATDEIEVKNSWALTEENRDSRPCFPVEAAKGVAGGGVAVIGLDLCYTGLSCTDDCD